MQLKIAAEGSGTDAASVVDVAVVSWLEAAKRTPVRNNFIKKGAPHISEKS